MCDGDLFDAFEGFSARCDVVDRVEDFCAVISHPAEITNTYHNLFENDESLFVLKGLAVNFLRSHGAIAALA
jgi:hypothetical protein